MTGLVADVTTQYGWAEVLDAARATRTLTVDVRAWVTARVEHYRDLNDGGEAAAAPAQPRPRPDYSPEDVLDALRAFIDARIELHLAQQTDPNTAPTPEPGQEPERGRNAMTTEPDRARRDLELDEQERQQHDLAADGVLDGDVDRDPGDDGAPEPDLEG